MCTIDLKCLERVVGGTSDSASPKENWGQWGRRVGGTYGGTLGWAFAGLGGDLADAGSALYRQMGRQ